MSVISALASKRHQIPKQVVHPAFTQLREDDRSESQVISVYHSLFSFAAFVYKELRIT